MEINNFMEPKLKFIGKVNSSLKRLEDCPLQENENAPAAELEIFPEFIDGIKDIEAGSDIILLTWLSRGDRKVIKCMPRNYKDSPLIGVFSTRSPDRPNPIGIHVVKVISVSPDGLVKVSGLEVLDQTALLDIKPIWPGISKS